MPWSVLFFIVVGAVSLAAAVGVVTSRQPIHSALFLLSHFVTLAVLYITLQAQFLAAIQVIVYAGGIVILILFVIMLIGSDPIKDNSTQQSWRPYIGLALGLVLVASIAYSLMQAYHGIAPAPTGLNGGTPYAVGTMLYTSYVLPVQLVAVLLLVALIGALLVARVPKSVSEERTPALPPVQGSNGVAD